MALKESEAIVLRTYPFRESDLLVTLFTRVEGKVRGVARAAKKSRRRFGGALEPLTYIKVAYEDRERQELARLASSEISVESRKLAAQMLRVPLSSVNVPASQKSGADLRKFLLQTLERHIEKKLVTRGMLERITC